MTAERYSYMLLEYSRTVDELERIRDRRGRFASMNDEDLVQHAETVISIQNEGWMAKLNETDEPSSNQIMAIRAALSHRSRKLSRAVCRSRGVRFSD
ncbi:hypothetical protein ACFWD1_29030 [Micromonospora chalcea]